MSQNKETTKTQDTDNKELEVLIIEGVVTEARIGKTRFSDTEKYRVSLRSDSIPYDNIHAFDKSGAKLTPKWFKDKSGYINLASLYPIPVKNSKGSEIDFDTWIRDYNSLGSTIKISVIQKDGALYPKALKVIEDGEARDPFEDL